MLLTDGADIQIGQVIAVTLGMSVIAIVIFHVTLGARLGRQFTRRRATQAYSPKQWAVISAGLGVSITWLVVLIVAQPQPPSLPFVLAEVAVNVPCLAYLLFAFRRAQAP